MKEKEYDAVRQEAGYRRLDTDVLYLSGEDRVDFVHNAVTNEVRDMEVGEGVRSLYLTPEGRTEIEMRVLENGDSYLVISELAEKLKETWENNIFIEDVKIKEGEFEVISLQGPRSSEILEKMEFTEPENVHNFTQAEYDSEKAYIVKSESTGEVGFDLLIPRESVGSLIEKLEESGVREFSEETHKVLRVEAGVPGFENELEGKIPLEAGLYDSIDFDKGCYIGQEVIARVEQRGSGPKRRLVGFVFSEEVEEGTDVFSDGKKSGEITSVVESPKKGFIGLGYLKKEVEEDEVVVGLDQIDAEVVELAFDY